MKGIEKLNEMELIALEEIIKLKEYSKNEFNMPIIDSFNTIDPNVNREFYWVFASPKNEFKEIEDKLYKSETWACKKHDKLVEQGYDVYLFSTEAYGGIGEDACPITYWTLETSKMRRAYLVFHEGMHEHIRRIKLELNDFIEEPICDYLGYIGSLNYFQKKEPLMVKEMIEYNEREYRFNFFINVYFDFLKKCYEKKLDRKPILKNANDYAIFYDFDEEINNASLLLHSYYSRFNKIIFNEMNKRPIKKSIQNIPKLVEIIKKQIPKSELIK